MDETTNKEMNEQILDRLNDLNSNVVTTNNSLKDLQEYLIIQDKKNQEEKEAEEKSASDKQDKEQTAKAEQSAKADAQNDTYTELLTNISNQLEYQNAVISGQSFMYGIISGILLFTILWNKITG